MTSPVRSRNRRWDIAGATYFVTLVTQDRRPIFGDQNNIALLREVLHATQSRHSFRMLAYAFMPDHIHLLIELAPKTHISVTMKALQQSFTYRFKKHRGLRRKVRLWQRGFWDHVIRDAEDQERHADYIHYNPVKHKLAGTPGGYAHSSFAAHVARGYYAADWALAEPDSIRGWDLG